jgi:uncharacterized protein (TIGR00661 family)
LTQKRILVAALNWGLGHASRSIPIIDALLAAKVEVILASDGEALALWRAEYPQLELIELPSYRVHYKYQNMFMNMGMQLPKFLNVINKERQIIASIISTRKIDALISDNRYGVYHHSCPSIFMSHQLKVIIPNIIISKAIEQLSRQIFKNFDLIWVPDYEQQEKSLSGKLSHAVKLKQPIRYIGPLSRLKANSPKQEKASYPIVALLSGPEPQRSYFEKKLSQELQQLDQQSLIIQGKPLTQAPKNTSKITYLNFLNGAELAKVLKQAELVIARSGYSSIMDFAALGLKQLLFVPTPGQTEQIYLAERALEANFSNYQKQSKLNIAEAWEKRKTFRGYPTLENTKALQRAIEELLKLKK